MARDQALENILGLAKTIDQFSGLARSQQKEQRAQELFDIQNQEADLSLQDAQRRVALDEGVRQLETDYDMYSQENPDMPDDERTRRFMQDVGSGYAGIDQQMVTKWKVQSAYASEATAKADEAATKVAMHKLQTDVGNAYQQLQADPTDFSGFVNAINSNHAVPGGVESISSSEDGKITINDKDGSSQTFASKEDFDVHVRQQLLAAPQATLQNLAAKSSFNADNTPGSEGSPVIELADGSLRYLGQKKGRHTEGTTLYYQNTDGTVTETTIQDEVNAGGKVLNAEVLAKKGAEARVAKELGGGKVSGAQAKSLETAHSEFMKLSGDNVDDAALLDRLFAAKYPEGTATPKIAATSVFKDLEGMRTKANTIAAEAFAKKGKANKLKKYKALGITDEASAAQWELERAIDKKLQPSLGSRPQLARPEPEDVTERSPLSFQEAVATAEPIEPRKTKRTLGLIERAESGGLQGLGRKSTL